MQRLLSGLLAFSFVTMAQQAWAYGLGPYSKDGYPRVVHDRPLVLPAGMGELALFGAIEGKALRPGAQLSFGVSDRLMLMAGSWVEVAPDKGAWHEATVGASYLVADYRALDLAPSIRASLGKDPILQGLHAGLGGRLIISHGIAIRFGDALVDLTNEGKTLRLNARGGLGFQFNDELSLDVEVDVIGYEVKPTRQVRHPANALPLSLHGTYSFGPRFDAYAQVHADAYEVAKGHLERAAVGIQARF